MSKSFEEMSTFEKIEECFNCVMKGELNSSLRNYFWELNSIIYNYERKNELLVSREELSKIKFFNIKLMRTYSFPEEYIDDMESFNSFERSFRQKENNSGATI